MVDEQAAARAVRMLLEAIGLDPDSEQLARTPQRVAEAASELFAGVGQDAAAVLGEGFPLEGPAQTVLIRDLRFRSVCEHHLLPFTGLANVAYMPKDRVVGLGRVPRMIDVLAARPQLQERLTEQIADTIMSALDAQGVVVVLDASHGCMMHRGPRQDGSSTLTFAARGVLAEPAGRAETVALLLARGALAGGGVNERSVEELSGGELRP